MPVSPGTWEAKVGGWLIAGQPVQLTKTLSQDVKKKKLKRTSILAQWQSASLVAGGPGLSPAHAPVHMRVILAMLKTVFVLITLKRTTGSP